MGGLSEQVIERLKKESLDARDGSYSPYSNFRVGAALLSADGEVITGANIENASIGGTICAERTAMVKAVSQGITNFQAIGVSSDLKDFCPPCGICRQLTKLLVLFQCGATTFGSFLFLEKKQNDIPRDPLYEADILFPKNVREFCKLSTPIYMFTTDGEYQVRTLEELLPMSFGPESMKS